MPAYVIYPAKKALLGMVNLLPNMQNHWKLSLIFGHKGGREIMVWNFWKIYPELYEKNKNLQRPEIRTVFVPPGK